MQHSHTLYLARLAFRVAVAAALVTLASCGDSRANHKVYPVKGKILVNNQPAAECLIVLNRTFEQENPVTPQGRTNENGEFQITTYFANDGAPEGEYVVTFEWRDRSGVTKQDFDGPDQLGGAYAKVEQTKALPGFVIKVERKALELPPFDLTQSTQAKKQYDEAKKRPSLGGPLGGSDK
jgi:hypothetical protein